MARKYIKDYRVELRLDSDGRQRSVPVYEGDYFFFTCSETALAALKRKYSILSISAVPLLLILMWFSDQFHPNYRWLILPAAFCVLPLFFTVTAAQRLRMADKPVTREHRDKICSRLPGASLAQAILATLCVAGQTAQCFIGGATTAAVLLAADAVLLAAVSWLMFLGRKQLVMEKVEPEP